jgi:hypothetical protein
MYGDQVSLVGTPFPNQTTYTIATFLLVPQVDSLQTLLANLPFFYYSHLLQTIIPAIESDEPQPLGFGGPNIWPLLYSVLPSSLSIQNVRQNVYNLSFQGSDSTGVLVDPQTTNGGSDYVFSVSAESPDITALVLPVQSGVSSYAVRSETGTTWSNFQLIQPGSQIPFDPVNGIEFVALDQNGNPVLTTNQIFGVLFDSTNTVSGTLIQSSTTQPPLPILQISPAGNQVSVAWTTNNASGLLLQTTTNLAAAWVQVTNVPVVVGNQLLVTLPITNESQFFRLYQ